MKHDETLSKVADRAMELMAEAGISVSKLDVLMDLEAADKVIPLDIEKLAAFDDGSFGHDIAGIRRHLNRITGELEDAFCPRCSLPE